MNARERPYRPSSPPSLAVKIGFDVMRHCAQYKRLGKTVYKCNLCMGGLHFSQEGAKGHYNSRHAWQCGKCRYGPSGAQQERWSFGSEAQAEAHARSHS